MRLRVLVLLAAVPGLAIAQSYSNLVFDPPGSKSTKAYGINNSGQVVGTYTDAAGNHGFLRSSDGSTYTVIDAPGALPGSTTATSTNNLGQVLGTFIDKNGEHGYVRSSDGRTFTIIDLRVVDVGVREPRAINDQGEIVGLDPVYRYSSVGFLRSADGTTYTSIYIPGAFQTSPQGICNDGTIIGWYTWPGAFTEAGGPSAAMHGFLRSPQGTYTSFDVSGGGVNPQPNGRNSLGQVAGTFAGGAAFVLYADGSTTTFTVPGASQTIPTAIADNGVVAGYTANDNGASHGFVAIPAPGGAQPAIRSVRGATSASGFGDSAVVAPGGWIEVYGQSLSATTREWKTSDFTGIQAPVSLDGVSVTVNGQNAFVSYISPGQINAQIPDTVAPGTAQVAVWKGSQKIATGSIGVSLSAGSLLVWPFFDEWWARALFQDGKTYVWVEGMDPLVPVLPSRWAKPGDTITLYAVGLGPVVPAVPAGQIATGPTTLVSKLEVLVGNAPARVTYAGSAPGTVGLYQINMIVPNVSGGFLTVSVYLNGVWMRDAGITIVP